MKQTIKENKRRWLIPACVVIAAVLVITALGFLFRDTVDPDMDPDISLDTPTAEVTQQPAVGEDTFQGIDVGDGLTLEGLSAMNGPYPEDGTDTYTENMMCATFTNYGSATLQYAKVHVTVDGVDYTFELSTLPVGESLCAFALDMRTAPEQVERVTTEAEHLLWFSEEPSDEEDKLQITFGAEGVTVKNISGQDIDREISIYFKTVVDGTYMGGITYRVHVGTLAAGGKATGFTTHAGEYSELMFVTYGN